MRRNASWLGSYGVFLSWCAALVVVIPLQRCQGRTFHNVAQASTLLSGIFGFGGDNKNDNKQTAPETATLTTSTTTTTTATDQRRPPMQSFGRSASAQVPPQFRYQRDSPGPYPRPTNSGHNRPLSPPPPPPASRVQADLEMTTTTTIPVSGEMINTTAMDDPPMDASEANDLPPPPPPPPLPQRWGVPPQPPQQQQQQQQQQQPIYQPPPLPQQQQQQQQHQQQGWFTRPPPPVPYPNNGWSSNDGVEDASRSYSGAEYFQMELEDALARESDLIVALDNLTATIVVREQREELHLRQLDVLTERIMDVEARAADDRNLLALFEANCTALRMTVTELQDDIEDWQRKCQDLEDRRKADQETLRGLQQQIREKQMEAEDLAIAIENVRLAERRRESGLSRKTHHRRGVLSWLASFFVSYDDDLDDSLKEDAYEMAKSTLLRALQTERGNVHELEAAVMSLQQNNSAISEMVESRDSIIDELNNRIAVFEEDKVVLKAALRQLQNEMKEEAPKAEKLLNDLSEAEEEIKQLKSEMNGVIQTHQEEIAALQQTIFAKQQAISETESNLTAIGTYVDRLEERLTSFAVTRRDMEEREKKCKDIEEGAIVTERERQALQVRVDEYMKQEEEFKKLLEELAAERTSLQKENRKLYTEREFRIAEQEQLQVRCSSLENTTAVLQNQLEEWRSKRDDLAPELEAARAANADLQSRLETMEAIQIELKSTMHRCAELEMDLNQTNASLDVEKAETQKLRELAQNQTLKLVEYEMKIAKEIKAKVPLAALPPAKKAKDERNVPLRKLRKQLSKATGIHGLLTPSSREEKIEQPRKDLQGSRPLPPKIFPPPPAPPRRPQESTSS